MPYTLPPLPFAVDALEPNIDKATMEIHHGKHHNAYVTNLNKAISESAPQLDGKPLHEILANNLALVPDAIKTAVRNNGGGHHNHSLFWEIINPAGKPGAAPVGAVLASNPKDPDPSKRVEFFVVGGTKDPLVKQIAEGPKKLNDKKYKALYREMKEYGKEYVNEDQEVFSHLLGWMETLDKQ